MSALWRRWDHGLFISLCAGQYLISPFSLLCLLLFRRSSAMMLSPFPSPEGQLYFSATLLRFFVLSTLICSSLIVKALWLFGLVS
jgi:hypothetical protein